MTNQSIVSFLLFVSLVLLFSEPISASSSWKMASCTTDSDCTKLNVGDCCAYVNLTFTNGTQKSVKECWPRDFTSQVPKFNQSKATITYTCMNSTPPTTYVKPTYCNTTNDCSSKGECCGMTNYTNIEGVTK